MSTLRKYAGEKRNKITCSAPITKSAMRGQNDSREVNRADADPLGGT